jgi:glycosyltransferase involved in cell wall biosynthesis
VTGTGVPGSSASVRPEAALTGPRGSAGRLLLFSYAFPPIQVQMTPAVIKPMAGLARQGFAVDVLSAAPFSPLLDRDDSLVPYAERHFGEITRLAPPKGIVTKLLRRPDLVPFVPDAMSALYDTAFDALMAMDLSRYDAVITWSPFHSINPVMVRLKRHRPRVRWLAQFSDPWAGNPLERSWFRRWWSRRNEPATIRAADHIVHSAPNSLDLMFRSAGPDARAKATVIPHPYDPDLYPARPKIRNEKITLRYLGALFGRRSPEALFHALARLLARRPDLRETFVVELAGSVPRAMLATPAARALPPSLVRRMPGVPYLASLERMYDADVLLLIEADVRQSLFVPSKLADYLGANTPIVGLVPPGGAEDILRELKCDYARPGDIDAIAAAVERTLDRVLRGSKEPWCDEGRRAAFASERIAGRFAAIVRTLTVAA